MNVNNNIIESYPNIEDIEKCESEKMGITLLDEEPARFFHEGNVVFIIFEDDKIKGMVNTKEDYDKKLEYHLFVSVLFVIPLHIRVAYLFDCLHREYTSGSSGKNIIVKWRYIGKSEWKDWFRITPYEDSYYF